MNATNKPELSHAEQNACGWLETIREHIACLEADRERFDELKDELESAFDDETGENITFFNAWLQATAKNADHELQSDAEELIELFDDLTVEDEILDLDEIRERIQESPLSVQVRGDWHDPGEEDEGPAEFEILLSTGGPALRIVGDLDQHCQPDRARLEYQDWGTPWTEKILDHADYQTLLAWAQQFYFGE